MPLRGFMRLAIRLAAVITAFGLATTTTGGAWGEEDPPRLNNSVPAPVTPVEAVDEAPVDPSDPGPSLTAVQPETPGAAMGEAAATRSAAHANGELTLLPVPIPPPPPDSDSLPIDSSDPSVNDILALLGELPGCEDVGNYRIQAVVNHAADGALCGGPLPQMYTGVSLEAAGAAREIVPENDTSDYLRGLGADPDPANFPSYCSNATLAGHLANRYQMCRVELFFVRMFDARTGRTLGDANFQIIEIGRMTQNRQTYSHEVRLNNYSSSGAMRSGLQVYSQVACSAHCRVTGATPSDGWTPLGVDQPKKGTWSISTPAQEIRYSTHRTDLTFYHPRAANYVGSNLKQVRDIRCENLPYFAGRDGACVWPEAGPVFGRLQISSPTHGKSAGLVWATQRDKADHWAAYYSTLRGKPLHRLTRTDYIDQNRAASCRGFVKRDSNDSCDEYPFASTYEGAAYVGRARVGVGHVPLSHNTNAGSQLGAFYQADRVIDGDAYYVVVRD